MKKTRFTEEQRSRLCVGRRNRHLLAGSVGIFVVKSAIADDYTS
jgi:hypothetical protein